MGGLWTPDKANVDPEERIGRRIFGAKYSKLEELPQGSETPLYGADIFEDERLEDDLSVDRLGLPTPTKAVTTLLTRHADKSSAVAGTTFHGWASIKAADCRAVVLAAPEADNDYHAVLSRSEFRSEMQAAHFSNSLRFYFQTKGTYEKPRRPKPKTLTPA